MADTTLQGTLNQKATATQPKVYDSKRRKVLMDMLASGEDPNFVRFNHVRHGFDEGEVNDAIDTYFRVTGKANPIADKTKPKADLSGASAGERQSIADIDSTIQMANEAKDLAKGVSTGLVSGNISRGKQSLPGGGDEKFNKLDTKLSNIKANFMKALSGAAVSEQEVQRLSRFLPDVTDQEEVIQLKLDALSNEMENRKKSSLKSLGIEPENVSGTTQPKSQDDQAYEWVQSHPDDPRAERINAKLQSIGYTPAAQAAAEPTETSKLVDQDTGEIKSSGFFDEISQPWFKASEGDSATAAGLKTAGNVIPSAIGFGKSVVDFLNPLNTVKAAQGVGEQIGTVLGSGEMGAGELATETVKGLPGAAAETLLPQFLRDIFKGDTRSAAMSIENDPVGQIAPLLLAARVAAQKAGKGAEFDSAITKIASPVTNAGETLKSGAGTALSGPTRFAVSQAVGISPETVSRIVKDPQSFSKEAQTTITRKGLADEIFGQLSTRQKDLVETGKQYEPIRQSGKVIDVKPTYLEDIIQKTTGLKIDGGKVVADTKSNFRDASDVRAIQKLYDDWNPRFMEAQMGADEFLNLRTDLAGLSKFERPIGKSAPIEAATQRMRGDLNSTYRKQIEGLSELDRENSVQRTQFDELKKGLLDKDGNLTPAAINRIANAAGKGKDLIAEQLEQLSPGITDKVKLLKAFEDIEGASGIRPGTYTKAGGALIGVATANVPLIVGSILAVPEMAVPILRGVGMAADKIGPVLKILGLPGELLNKSPDMIPEVTPKGSIKKGKGAIPEIATKDGVRTLASGSDPLLQEAGKKYYRGGPASEMPKGMTARDIVNYEVKDLGNADVKVETGVNLDSIPSERLRWLTEKSKDAKEYGNVTADTGNYRVVARDSQGGVLVDTKPDLYNKAQGGVVHERAKNLSPENRSIEDAAFAKIDSQGEKILADYTEKYGKVVNADNFRPFFKEEGYAGKNAAAVQEPSSELSKLAYKKALENPERYAVFTSGQSGAGKSSALKNIESYSTVEGDAAVVLDSNLSNWDSSMKKVKQAEAAGKVPIFYYVYREPFDALVNGIIKRMRDNPDEMGRIVPNTASAENGPGSWNVAKRLHEEGYIVNFIDNSFGSPKKAKMVSFDEISTKVKYPKDLKKQFDNRVKSLYEKGDITKEEYDAYVAE